MSVINKMLRDLDARQASSAEISLDSGTRVVRGGSAGLAHGSTDAGPRSSRGLRWLSGLLLLLAAAAAAWYLTQETTAPEPKAPQLPAAVVSPAPGPAAVASAPIAAATPSEQAASAASAPPAQAPVPAPVPQAQTPAAQSQQPVASAAAAKPVPAPGMPTKPVVVVQAKPSAQVPAATPAQPPVPARRVEAAKVPAAPATKSPQAAVNSQRLSGQSAPVAAPGPGRVPADASTSGRAAGGSAAQLQRQAAAQETLAQAQSLWALGSREQALDLMREAVAVAERAYNSGSVPADSPVLASLVRELARMELAEGRVGRVLEMLTRLEPALSRQADLWAVRGNAAQRLGRHQESVQAYFKALELRPDESRWMLGAAVSLAAMGRLDAAAEQAEKARATGVVSPEILTYLRQAGVPLK